MTAGPSVLFWLLAPGPWLLLMFEFFIARRYLRAKRKQVVISVITVISVAGVAAGVMALVIALAINNGFGTRWNATCSARPPMFRFWKRSRAKE